MAFLIPVALLVLLFAFVEHEGRRRAVFRAACLSLREGDVPGEIERSLVAAGGVEYTGADRADRVWHIDAPMWGRIGICTVSVDELGRVVWSEAKGNRPD
jgi:hypothetical protein